MVTMLSQEAAEAVFRGEFEGGNDSSVQTLVIDEDGDGTTFKRKGLKGSDADATQHIECTVTRPSGKTDTLGVADRIVFYSDTSCLHVNLRCEKQQDAPPSPTPPAPAPPADGEEVPVEQGMAAGPRGWKIPLKRSLTPAQQLGILQNVFKVCGRVVPVAVETESGSTLARMCAEYTALLGSSVTTGGTRELRMAAMREETDMVFRKSEGDLIQAITAHSHLRDEVLPDVMDAVDQLQVMFQHIDVIESYVTDTVKFLDQLEAAVSSHSSAPSSALVSMAKRIFSGIGKKTPHGGAHDILTIGGLPPADFEAQLKASLRQFHLLRPGETPSTHPQPPKQ
eukprot:TRINITY_DN65947_c0_g1_i1.p1 TRINITY_DN65947_c0_g1~~TRINITY_DN65947_c0_g1_i1.p1  ORF type:complete len:339 (+),score=121.40 TRINITY_DN65947_c0_g1_i1:124-1140(+)